MKVSGSLQGPSPASFQVCTHHLHVPIINCTEGVTEQMPVPAAHPACAAAYHVWIFGTLAPSFTHSRYQVAFPTAFQVYLGDGLAKIPPGEISVVFPGGSELPKAKASPSLQGP